MSSRKRTLALPRAETLPPASSLHALDDDEQAHPLAGQFSSALELLLKPVKRDLDSNEKVFVASFIKLADGLASAQANLVAFVQPVHNMLGYKLLNDLTASVDTLSTDELHSLTVDMLRRYVRAADKAEAYACDQRKKAASNVKLSAALAEAVAQSYCVDLISRAGLAVQTPLLDHLVALVPNFH